MLSTGKLVPAGQLTVATVKSKPHPLAAGTLIEVAFRGKSLGLVIKGGKVRACVYACVRVCVRVCACLCQRICPAFVHLCGWQGLCMRRKKSTLDFQLAWSLSCFQVSSVGACSVAAQFAKAGDIVLAVNGVATVSPLVARDTTPAVRVCL